MHDRAQALIWKERSIAPKYFCMEHEAFASPRGHTLATYHQPLGAGVQLRAVQVLAHGYGHHGWFACGCADIN